MGFELQCARIRDADQDAAQLVALHFFATEREPLGEGLEKRCDSLPREHVDPCLDMAKELGEGEGAGDFTPRNTRMPKGCTAALLELISPTLISPTLRLEQREDTKLSTLRRYVKALGGELDLAVTVGPREGTGGSLKVASSTAEF